MYGSAAEDRDKTPPRRGVRVRIITDDMQAPCQQIFSQETCYLRFAYQFLVVQNRPKMLFCST